MCHKQKRACQQTDLHLYGIPLRHAMLDRSLNLHLIVQYDIFTLLNTINNIIIIIIDIQIFVADIHVVIIYIWIIVLNKYTHITRNHHQNIYILNLYVYVFRFLLSICFQKIFRLAACIPFSHTNWFRLCIFIHSLVWCQWPLVYYEWINRE